MSQTEPFLYKIKGSSVPGLAIAACKLVTSTSGTISTSESWGCAVAKTATETGRYTVTLARAVAKFLAAIVTVIGPDDTALTTTKGLVHAIRDDDLATDGTIEIQMVETVTANADTDLQDGASLTIVIFFIDTAAS